MSNQIDTALAAAAMQRQLLANVDVALVEGNWPPAAEWAMTDSVSKETEFFLSKEDFENRYEECRIQAVKEERCFSLSVYTWDWGPVFVEKRHIVV